MAASNSRAGSGVHVENSAHRSTGGRGFVTRRRILERLVSVPGGHCVCVVAPAGFGKSVLLDQWAHHDDRRVITISLDRTHNDPTVLTGDIVAAISDASDGARSPDHRPSGTIADALGAVSTPTLILIDQADSLHTRSTRELLESLVVDIPTVVTLGLATRAQPRISTGTLRSRGAYTAIGPGELALDRSEAAEVLANLQVAADELDEIMQLTEGWPVGVYLAAAASGNGAPGSELRVDAIQRDIGEYLDEAVIGHFSPGRRDFMLRTSILERLTGPLCDATLETTGANATLEQLARSTSLVAPTGEGGIWYRYPRMLGDHLRRELRRRDDESIPQLHARAAAWFHEHDMPDAAIHHAQRARDVHLAASLVAAYGRPAFNAGKAEEVIGWLSWFADREVAVDYPELAVIGAIACAVTGNEAEAERWASRLLDGDDGPEGIAHLVRALVRPADLSRMSEDVQQALATAHATSPWHTATVAACGLACMLSDDSEQALAHFRAAVVHGDRFSALGGATFARGFHAGYLLERGSLVEAKREVDAALDDIEGTPLARYAMGAVVFPVAARCAIRSHDPDSAKRFIARAAAARPSLSPAFPIVSCIAFVSAARAYLEVGDVAGARQMAADANRMMVGRGDFGTLSADLDHLAGQLRALPSGEVGASSLTGAELRLLPHLATHLTFPEIGERLYVSRHTVKTQAMSIYRKLDASSRSEAVDRARSLGLLPGN